MKTQLLCTFTKRNHFNETIDIIIACNDIVFNKIYVFSNENDPHQLICTYNVEFDEDFVQGIQDTISLHRKKNTNTLYTINALNELIKSLNGGVVDTKFLIEWQHYRNTILLTQHNELKQLKTKIFKIIDLN